MDARVSRHQVSSLAPLASVVTASRGINSAVLLAAGQPDRVEALVGVAPYLEFEPAGPDEDSWVEREHHDG